MKEKNLLSFFNVSKKFVKPSVPGRFYPIVPLSTFQLASILVILGSHPPKGGWTISIITCITSFL
jgi:hypothetical protein